MTGSDGDWHESLHTEGPAAGSSNRAFGLLFAAVCGAIAAIAAWHGRHSALWWSIAALAFCLASVLSPPVLGPLNRAWRWLSLQLSRIVSPVVMTLIFFAVLTPVGMLMRWAGNDPLRLRFEPQRLSYWLPRSSQGERQTSMTKQF